MNTERPKVKPMIFLSQVTHHGEAAAYLQALRPISFTSDESLNTMTFTAAESCCGVRFCDSDTKL